MSPRALMAWLWTLTILGLCWLPRSLMPANEKGPKPFFVPNIDKLVHLGIFAVFAFLWMRVGHSDRRIRWIFAAGVALAIISELGQELPIVDRDANVMDGVADVLGVAFGLFSGIGLEMFLAKKAVPAEPEEVAPEVQG